MHFSRQTFSCGWEMLSNNRQTFGKKGKEKDGPGTTLNEKKKSSGESRDDDASQYFQGKSGSSKFSTRQSNFHDELFQFTVDG